MKITAIILVFLGAASLLAAICSAFAGVWAYSHPPDPGNIAGLGKLLFILFAALGVPILGLGLGILIIRWLALASKRKIESLTAHGRSSTPAEQIPKS